MTRVLVTGARGYVGRHVTAALVASGFEVHAITAALPIEVDAATWHRADLLDPVQREAVVAAVRADALVHLAWASKPPGYWRDPDNLRWVAASLELVRSFAAHGGTRVVGAGTCAEYDWGHGYCTERLTPVAGSSLYGAAKAACGNILEAYGREVGLSVAWGRLFFLFGPYDWPGRLIPSLVTRLHSGLPARCASGRLLRDFLFVVDAADALVALLASEVTGPVNIASGVPRLLADIAREVAARVGRPDLLEIDDAGSEHTLVAANVARLHAEVAWRPRHDFASALDQTVLWWSSPEAKELTA